MYGYKLNDMNTYLIFGNIGATELILIALVVLLFFGGKKIPELMKGLGKVSRASRKELMALRRI